MRYLLDTGIIVRLVDPLDPDHDLIRRALRRLAAQGSDFVCARQNMVEFWSVCTRPTIARGGMGLTLEETSHRLRVVERIVGVLNEPDSAYAHWKSLVINFKVSGKQVHDARIVAVMIAYRIKRLLTLKASDFKRYGQIEAFHPKDILA